MLHYYSRIIFILILLIFYFKNLKSGSLSVHWALVSDTNFKSREEHAVKDVDPLSNTCMLGVSAQVTHVSDTTPVTRGKWPVIIHASPAGGKKENPKPAPQRSSVGKGNGEKILPSYISRSPGKQRTTLCLKWGSLNKSWLSLSFIPQTSLAVALTAPLRGECAIWVAKGVIGNRLSLKTPRVHYSFFFFFPFFLLVFQSCFYVLWRGSQAFYQWKSWGYSVSVSPENSEHTTDRMVCLDHKRQISCEKALFLLGEAGENP